MHSDAGKGRGKMVFLDKVAQDPEMMLEQSVSAAEEPDA